MKKALYHLSGASLLVGAWRALLWLFAWPLALIGFLHRRAERREARLLKAIAATRPAPAPTTEPEPERPDDYQTIVEDIRRSIPAWAPAPLRKFSEKMAPWQARAIIKRGLQGRYWERRKAS